MSVHWGGRGAGHISRWSTAPIGVPTLALNFLETSSLDSRITFTRGSTATFTGSNGLIQSAAINTPRFDYDPVTLASKGLLIEEQRTNLVLRSEEFDTASWAKNNGTVTANTIASPDGTTNADAFIENTAASVFHSMSQTLTKAASSIQYAASVYVKDKGRLVSFNIQSGSSNGVTGRVNPATGAVVQNAAAFGTGWTAGTITIANVGGGWYRVVLTATSDTLTSLQIQVSLNNGTTSVYTGDGVSGAFLYGAQVEAGAFATSYIPTVAATVTRSADIATMSGTNFSSWYNQSEGTIFASVDTVAPTGSPVLSFQDGAGAATNRQQMNIYSSFSATVVSNVTQSNIGTNTNTSPKLVYAYKANDFAACANGAAVATDTSGTVPTTLAYATLGKWDFGSAASLNGHLRAITYYPQRLPNATLQALTA